MEEIFKLYIRYALGILTLLLGIVLMLIPFLPFGYVFITFSLLMLAPKMPILKKLIKWIKEKDKRGNLNKVEKKLNQFENWLHRKFLNKKRINSTPQ